MTEPAHRTDLRLFLKRHPDDEPVTIHIGATGYGELTVGELLEFMQPTDLTCNCGTCLPRRAATGT